MRVVDDVEPEIGPLRPREAHAGDSRILSLVGGVTQALYPVVASQPVYRAGLPKEVVGIHVAPVVIQLRQLNCGVSRAKFDQRLAQGPTQDLSDEYQGPTFGGRIDRMEEESAVHKHWAPCPQRLYFLDCRLHVGKIRHVVAAEVSPLAPPVRARPDSIRLHRREGIVDAQCLVAVADEELRVPCRAATEVHDEHVGRHAAECEGSELRRIGGRGVLGVVRVPIVTVCATVVVVHGREELRLKRVLQYVDENLAGKITLQHLAAVAGLSRMHFAAQFRAAVGMRPHDFLLKRRIERAQELLRRADARWSTLP